MSSKISPCLTDGSNNKNDIGTKPTKPIQPKSTCPKLIKPIKRKFSNKYFSLSYYKNNPIFTIFAIGYLLLSLLFVLIQLLVLYPYAEWYVKMARFCGILLNFNSCLVIMLVLRRVSTWLKHFLNGPKFAFLDDSIEFHKILGILIFVFSFIHTLGQCINFYYLSSEFLTRINSTTVANGTYGQLLFSTNAGVGWIGNGAMITGWILLVIVVVMTICAAPFVRRNGHFQVFFVTHLLHYAYYTVLFFHATHFWKWFIGPFILVVIERAFNLYRKNSKKYGKSFIKDVHLLSSRVTHLVITRPKNFKYECGDYIFIKIPKLAQWEWHPFTISSPPELEDELWVHIRSLGNWTNKLHDFFIEFQRNVEESAKEENFGLKNLVIFKPSTTKKFSKLVISTDFNTSSSINKTKQMVNLNSQNQIFNAWIELRLDGPFGTASRRILDSKHPVLIAGGIGVTPFASILQSLYQNHHTNTVNNDPIDTKKKNKLKKVDFVWVNRDFSAFEWFIEVLGELELNQLKSGGDRFIRMHLFMTSAKVEQEVKLVDVIDLNEKNREINTKESLPCNVENFSIKLNPGRPVWNAVFKEFTDNSEDVDVFFCGAPAMGLQINKACKKFKYTYAEEKF